MNQNSRRVRERTWGKEQSYFKKVFVEATITGRNNQDSDSAAKSDHDDNAVNRWWLRKDSLTVSGFINRIADKLQQLTVKSQVVYFFRTRCTTAFGLCAVNEKRQIAQEHRLNLSYSRATARMNKIAWFCAQNFPPDHMGGGDGSVHPCLGQSPLAFFWLRAWQDHRLNLSEFKGNCKWIWSTWQHVNSLEMRR